MSRLSSDDLETWSALATVLEWLPTALDTQLQRDAALTHFEYGVMFALAHAENRTLRMSTLAGYSNSSLSRLSRAVARLETKDWIRRAPDPTDGRFTLAILTDAGERKVEQATPGHEATVNQLVFDSLTTAQTQQLRDISRRITTAIRTQDGWTLPPKATP
ncbi:MarR family transcriptional regulator [Streptomyces sp. ISL-112]|uniref:MarR family winged helix-turn-helix transcriptional regulator n=1 Tax=unclassified Streptomyces TaxID=2593676 RepID=UPI001BE50C05|nr:MULTISPECIES: MarR family transcriptional regulator [unclassified Streptomyces]MBT2430303.1 MarR family transcriptional regulator [Streptomyces sp. ISL-112]MBT2466273.1 MarR family transcriptional regulator [Streptomyces sp. ISL-63]